MNDGFKQKIPASLIESVEEDLPTPDEIERFAEKGILPENCTDSRSEYIAKIMLALTRKVYHSGKAERYWNAIVEHENWLADRLGRRPGINVAALDYLMNIRDEWNQAVVAEVNHIENLVDAATQDGLTGLYVRGVFEQWLEKSVAESQRYGVSLSLLLADIDNFKEINDVHGHQTGDYVLKKISAEFVQNLRSADFAARYGGEELVALLPHTDLDATLTVAEKIRVAVNDRFKDDLQVTVSIGVACWQVYMNKPADLVRAADVALYKAKETGKNRVIAAPNHPYNP
jgi:diguanylate cyclase (GGDEF)-like protein